jgi:hypothetical protein
MEEYFLFHPTISRSSTKLVENSHPTTELVVTLNVNHEEHVLSFEAYTSKDSIKQNIENNTTWSTMNGSLQLIKLE